MRVLPLLLVAACRFPPGTVSSDAPNIGLDGNADMAGTDGAAPGIVFVGANSAGVTGNGIVRVAATGMSSATYVLAVVTRPYQPVLSVFGLAAMWTRIGDQCGARSQTGVALYVGRNASISGDIEVTLQAIPANAIAAVAIYTGSSGNGATATYNAVNVATCDETSASVDVASYTFPIASTAGGLVVTGLAIRGAMHTPDADLVERVQKKQGIGGDIAGIAITDGEVTTVAGTLNTAIDLAAVAIELRP